MKYYRSLLTIMTFAMSIALATPNSYASSDADEPQAMEHQHHHHEMANTGYTRSIAAYQMPDVKLLDADGNEVVLADSLDVDEPIMLNFIFTTCTTICPVTSSTFSQVQEKLGQERDAIRMVSISIDPEHDSPAQLSEYAKRFEAGSQWSMLTGSIEDSIAVQRAFNVYRGDKMNHEPVTFIRNGSDQPWVRIDGFASADELLREYRNLTSNQ